MQKVAIIGGGIAGMEAAGQLNRLGYEVVIIEKNNVPGGNVANWDRLFPHQRPAGEVVRTLEHETENATIIKGKTVINFEKSGNICRMELSDGKIVTANAVLITTGFRLFPAEKKEEYGYKIYDNVITSADLEKMFSSGKGIVTPSGKIPEKIAFIHCVGSRDEKVNNRYCSKVCCATAVKQACEVKEALPESEVFCLYMDLRMFDRHYETMYHEAQTKFGINFIRGRLSETSEDNSGRIVVKCEDTLAGKPLKMTVDLVVLMVGMEGEGNRKIAEVFKIQMGKDGFLDASDDYLNMTQSSREGIFLAGTCTGPKNIPETIAEARAAVSDIHVFLNRQQASV
jgi:heterodisulfide reductase subunit A